jgi:CrcB protein
MSTVLWTMLGGSLGALSRYFMGLWIMKAYKTPRIPIAMVLVNGFGSFGLGVLLGATWNEQNYFLLGKEGVYSFLAVGFFGAFTTFSTFSVEAIMLWQKGKVKEFVLYVMVTVVMSIALFILGTWLGML